MHSSSFSRMLTSTLGRLFIVVGLLYALVPVCAVADSPACGANSNLTLNTDSNGSITVSNGFVCIYFSKVSGSITYLSGDFQGKGNYGVNTLSSGGIVVERENNDGNVMKASSGDGLHIDTQHDDSHASITVTGIMDGSVSQACSSSQLVIYLQSNSRSIRVSLNGKVTVDCPNVKVIRLSMDLVPSSIYGLYDGGVVQMRNADTNRNFFPSLDRVSRFFALGSNNPFVGSVTIAGNVSLSFTRRDDPSAHQLSMLRADKGTGFQLALAGNLDSSCNNTLDVWGSGWNRIRSDGALIRKDTPIIASFDLWPNNGDFPTMGLSGDVSMLPNKDLNAILTGVWPSSVGNLNTHRRAICSDCEALGQIATTIHNPDTGYSGTYNYFDPDNYFSVSAMLIAGDDYLNNQVKFVLERTLSTINTHGQIAHHFEGDRPVYVALSGATQTGPNIFFILSCLNYAKYSGNHDWLVDKMPLLRNASSFLFDMIQSNDLLLAPGSLMIDVFIRGNFTADSNAMFVQFLRDFAEAEDAVLNHPRADTLRALADKIIIAMNKNLIAPSYDHYITQLNPDGTTRDFIDYDANLIALSVGAASDNLASRIFQRVGSGNCTHARATWVSERYYGPDDTTNGNTGDSECAMARIGWFDSLSRVRYNDPQTFNSVLLEPLKADLLKYTWLSERYDCSGKPVRTQAYFEYPALVTMQLSQLRYGLRLGHDSLSITPFGGPTTFTYTVGSFFVDYDDAQKHVAVSATGDHRIVTVNGMGSSLSYNVTSSNFRQSSVSCSAADQRVVSTKDGVLTFGAFVHNGACLVTATLVQS